MILLFVSFAAFAALKRPRPCVCSHVVLQMTSRDTSVVAMVTLVRLLPRMVSHHVLLQTRIFCICEAVLQSGFFCGASMHLNELMNGCIDYIERAFLQCVS